MALESFFMTGYLKYYWKCTKSIVLDFTDFCCLPPSQLKVLNFEACVWMTFNRLKSNSTKLIPHTTDLKIEKLLSFFDFQFLMQHPLCSEFSEWNLKTCPWGKGHCFKIAKIQQTMFVWVCELQTPKPEHGCKIKADRFLAGKLMP